VVFDTGPLITFACSNSAAFQAIGRIYGAQATWCAAVRDEIADKAQQPQHICCRQVLRANWLPHQPVALDTPQDLHDIEDVRQVFVRRDDGPRKHLGEAASIVLARRLSLPVVIDDQDAANYARAIEGLTVYRTLNLLLGILEANEVSCADGWETYRRMTAVSALPTVRRSELCPSSCGRHR
jgi:hypothetical protein